MVLALAIDVYSLVTLILAVLAIVALGYVQFRGHGDHEAEDRDRSYFDEHGRWPDEPESAARRRPGGYGGVDDLRGRD
jgi:hypothetical protein